MSLSTRKQVPYPLIEIRISKLSWKMAKLRHLVQFIPSHLRKRKLSIHTSWRILWKGLSALLPHQLPPLSCSSRNLMVPYGSVLIIAVWMLLLSVTVILYHWSMNSLMLSKGVASSLSLTSNWLSTYSEWLLVTNGRLPFTPMKVFLSILSCRSGWLMLPWPFSLSSSGSYANTWISFVLSI